jgi:hypothetical protein
MWSADKEVSQQNPHCLLLKTGRQSFIKLYIYLGHHLMSLRLSVSSREMKTYVYTKSKFVLSIYSSFIPFKQHNNKTALLSFRRWLYNKRQSIPMVVKLTNKKYYTLLNYCTSNVYFLKWKKPNPKSYMECNIIPKAKYGNQKMSLPLACLWNWTDWMETLGKIWWD